MKLIGALLLQVATLCGAACAQSRELTEADHALYRGEYGRASQIARQKTFMKNEEAQQEMKKAWPPTQHA